MKQRDAHWSITGQLFDSQYTPHKPEIVPNNVANVSAQAPMIIYNTTKRNT